MAGYKSLIHKTVLFRKVPEEDIDDLLGALDSQLKHYAKDQIIVNAGQKVRRAGILMEGNALLVETDFWGRRKELDRLASGRILLASDAAARTVAMYSVVAETSCVILWLNAKELLKLDSSRQSSTEVLRRFMRELALENRELYKRISNLDRSTTKEKLLSYLSKEAIRNHSAEFDIPFDRRELADYLSVERSAMSAELSALAKQGYLETNRNHFRLLKQR